MQLQLQRKWCNLTSGTRLSMSFQNGVKFNCSIPCGIEPLTTKVGAFQMEHTITIIISYRVCMKLHLLLEKTRF